MRRSKRQLGGSTVIVRARGVQAKPRRSITASHSACVTGMPMTLAARSTRSVTGPASGSVDDLVVDRPERVSLPPQISTISAVMRSMCSTVVAGSTPRSKRCPASVEKLKRRERPATASGHQNAAST